MAFVKTDPSARDAGHPVSVPLRAVERGAVVSRRSGRHGGTPSSAGRCCCGRRAAARSGCARPIRPIASRIQQNFLCDERDLPVLRAGLRLLREVAAQPALTTVLRPRDRPGRRRCKAMPSSTPTSAQTRRHRASSLRHLPHGRRTSDAVVDARASRARRRGPAHRRRVGHAGPRRRQHQRRRHHDRREGRRHDSRQRPRRDSFGELSQALRTTDENTDTMWRHGSCIDIITGCPRRRASQGSHDRFR